MRIESRPGLTRVVVRDIDSIKLTRENLIEAMCEGCFNKVLKDSQISENKRKEKYKKNKNNGMSRLRQRRREQGLCGNCGRERDREDRKLCELCRKEARENSEFNRMKQALLEQDKEVKDEVS